MPARRRLRVAAIASATLGCSAYQIEKGAAVEAQDLAIGLGHDGGGPRIVGEKRHLAEGLAGVCRTFTRISAAPLFSARYTPTDPLAIR